MEKNLVIEIFLKIKNNWMWWILWFIQRDTQYILILLLIWAKSKCYDFNKQDFALYLSKIGNFQILAKELAQSLDDAR